MALSTGFLSFNDSWLSSVFDPSGLGPISEVAEEADIQSLHDSAQADADNDVDTVSALPPAKRRRINAYCMTCGQQFTEKRSLYRHQRSSKSCTSGNLLQEEYLCPLCTKVFSRADTRYRHETEHHHSQGRRKISKIASSFLDPRNEQDLPDPVWPNELIQLNENEPIEPTSLISTECDDLHHILCQPDYNHAHGDLSIAADIAATPSTILPVFDEDAASMRSATSRISLRGLVSLPFRSRSSLERLGASFGYKTFKNFPPCPACKQPFEIDKSRLMAHIHSHVQDWQQEFVCTECDVGFQCQQNLEYHLVSASQGSCGFIGLEHPCSGHHPPDQSGKEHEFTYHEHLLLCSFLRHWEEAQLDSLIVSIDELTLRDPNLNNRRWSFSIARRSPSSRASSRTRPKARSSRPVR